MYIARRTGAGRGVFELAGRTDAGVASRYVAERELVLEFSPHTIIKTGIVMKIQGKKPRLVLIDEKSIHIQRQIAAILLMPKPVRSGKHIGTQPPILISGSYVIDKIMLEKVNITELTLQFSPGEVTIANQALEQKFSAIGRFGKVVTAWNNLEKYPSNISSLLQAHRNIIESGNTADEKIELIVEELQNQCYSWAISKNVAYQEGADVFLLLDQIAEIDLWSENDEETQMNDGSSEGNTLPAGARRRIWVNAYERNPIAREQCLAFYGYGCSVCKMSFQVTYGEIGKGFVHVHHLKPVSELGDDYLINPIDDLRPVCPNCHAMLHKRTPPYTIEELSQILDTNI